MADRIWQINILYLFNLTESRSSGFVEITCIEPVIVFCNFIMADTIRCTKVFVFIGFDDFIHNFSKINNCNFNSHILKIIFLTKH